MPINLDDLTIGEAKRLAALFSAAPAAAAAPEPLACYIGQVVVVRSTQSGVWLGTVEAVSGSSLTLTGARRAYYWRGAATCSGLATHGPSPDGSKIPAPVPRVTVLDACEVCATTDAARARWAAVPEWVA